MKSIFVFLLAAGLLSGCANSPTPNYDLRFGEAVRNARSAMTLNPNAGATPPIYGTDGKTAAEAAGRYHESFKTPPPVVNVINIGGVAGGNSGGGR